MSRPAGAISQKNSAVSQMLERNQALFVGKRLLVCGALEDDYPRQLAELAHSLTVFTTDYCYYRSQQAALGDAILFDHQLGGAPRFNALLLLMPKAKAEAQYLLAMMTPLLESGAELFLAGENRGGINGADKLLAPYGEKPIKRDSARRCSLYHGTLDKPVVPFELDAWFSRYECQAGDTTLTVMALPGVFSADGLDLGTQMLLASLPPVTGKLLDFGCGAGVIGSVLAKRNPALAVTMVDINALALESSRRTLAVNGLSGRVHASDVYSDIAETFQQIVSNPPFHAGLKTFYAATETFLAKAPEYLTANGALTIVANAFLRYQPILDAHFKQTEVIAGDAKFKVYLSKA
ncbi:ribosomal RNA small subunit methyltransferase C [Aeromonas caviae]|uniref:Ribosomal RNA small subunit methyltransferase C n=1 Tax=Aeromonas caviae TaxID=648 RepID=A0AA37CVI6_AERCA|nr:16S rRNA (guanine(1207)-N(2))-methyltransferase RsmC [Aeromonas sp. Prich7-2]GJA18679.1 ribosomal RNA small subunit methyltransferase C [Aeromonas caviae]GJA26173.1 ribosomal RNA small subunit methyltransferase C [Aeromonas caviae]GJA61861.1 ribosomal RNA small subunit methyltransferase C [Aeromonas caviae]GJA70628.1 ribosomal RNA small subunit methyltransferase C [Aeromonas caviae]